MRVNHNLEFVPGSHPLRLANLIYLAYCSRTFSIYSHEHRTLDALFIPSLET